MDWINSISNMDNTINEICIKDSCLICILIERLVTKTSVLQNDNATDEFIKNHQDFIQDIHASFKNIESHYSIVIPDSEMKYIYSFFEHEGETK